MSGDDTRAEGCVTKVNGGQSGDAATEEERRAKLRSGSGDGQVSAGGSKDSDPGPVVGSLVACKPSGAMATFFGKMQEVTRHEVPTDKPDQSVGKVDPTDDSGKPEAEGVLASIPKGVCKDFLNKVCKRGYKCKYNHPGATRTAPKLRPACLNFLNRKCKLTLSHCKFRHISEAEHEKEKAERAQRGDH